MATENKPNAERKDSFLRAEKVNGPFLRKLGSSTTEEITFVKASFNRCQTLHIRYNLRLQSQIKKIRTILDITHSEYTSL